MSIKAPLPELLRPKTLELFVGQEHLKSKLENNIPNYLITKTFAKHFSDLVNVYENLLSRNR